MSGDIYWRTLIRKSEDTIIVISRDGTIEEVNAKMPPESVGQSIANFVPVEEHKQMALDCVERVCSTGKQETIEMESGGKWYSITTLPVVDAEKVIQVTRDVTERVELVNELKSKNDDLEKMADVMVSRELKMKKMEERMRDHGIDPNGE